MSEGEASKLGDAAEGAAEAPEQKLSYDPGWTSSTWQGAEAEPLPRPTIYQRVRSVARMISFALATLALIPIFFLARALGGRRDRTIAALWCGSGVRMAGLKVRQIGAPIGTGGALLVNHPSWLDIMLVGSRAPVHFVAKSEVAGWPIFGWIGKISNTVFIARKRAEAKAQEQLLARRVREGDLLCLYPEGTNSDGQRVLPFKTSLFSLFYVEDPEGGSDQKPFMAQPVTVHYAPQPGLPKTLYAWWGKMELFGHIQAVTRFGSGVATIHFHEPLDPRDFPNRKALAAEAERRVREGLEAAIARADAITAHPSQ